MRTIQTTNAPHRYRLIPESEIEALVLGHLVARFLAKEPTHFRLPNHPDHSATWKLASRTDDAGFVRAHVQIKRPRPDISQNEPNWILAYETADEQVALIQAKLYLAGDAPDAPQRLRVFYRIPHGEWVPDPDGLENSIDVPPLLMSVARTERD